MNKTLILQIFLIFFCFQAHAQITSISPNIGAIGQTLTTTVTGSGLFIQASTPSGNISVVYLEKGADVINIFNGFSWVGEVVVLNSDSFSLQVPVPAIAVPGVYDLIVGVDDDTVPGSGTNYYTLPTAFTVQPPDGYITGMAYNDLNRDGIKDAGEPGLGGRYVTLFPHQHTLTTNANGSFIFPVFNGNYWAVTTNNDFVYEMFPTTSDTIAITVNNDTVAGNDFGLKYALDSITPQAGHQGVSSTHIIKSNEPIFHPGPNPWGNVLYLEVKTSPNFFVDNNASIIVLDSFTVEAQINVPASTPLANNINLEILTYENGDWAEHLLAGQFNIYMPLAFVSGNMFFDQNQNKIKDTGEPGISYGKVKMDPDGSIAFSDTGGNFLVGSLGGPQTLYYENNINDLSLFTDSASYSFNVTGPVTDKDFGFISIAPDYSLDVKALYTRPRCNTDQPVTFKIRNISNVACDVTAWLRHNPLLTYVSSPLPPTNISNDTIYWSLTNLQPYTEVTMEATFLMPAAGNPVYLKAGADALDVNGAVQFSDNIAGNYAVSCSWDPNDKQVTPPGVLAQNYTLMSDTLEYLIRFQNTGNDTAFNVVVLDTLDSNLDLNTFEILGSSHSLQTEIESSGAAKFAFNNIMLPDSNVNEPGSNGYIMYSIRAKTGLPDNTPVNNTAHIFFDMNPDVITNTTLNTLVYVLPTGIHETTNESNGVSIYPNPFTNSATVYFENTSAEKFELYISSLTGKQVSPVQSTTGNTFIIQRNTLAKGIYFYELKNALTGISRYGKFIVE